MELREIQTRLKILGSYSGDIDGVYGKLTKEAIYSMLKTQGVEPGYTKWPKSNLLVGAAQAIYKLDGIEVGKVDGFIGPQTRYAESVYDERKKTGGSREEIWRDKADAKPVPPKLITPESKEWPRQRDVASFYGHVGDGQVSIKVPYTFKIAWNLKQTVNKITCHKKVSEQVQAIFDAVLAHYGIEEIKRLKLDVFAGSLNIRKMRGGSSWSMHSWGIAFDFDSERNQLKWNKSRAQFAKKEYIPWFEIWEAHGATSLGRTKDYDWMHTQFARL
jgi:peptidoglycan hydrolase-like protein with peptidoglycan-binding domain